MLASSMPQIVLLALLVALLYERRATSPSGSGEVRSLLGSIFISFEWFVAMDGAWEVSLAFSLDLV